MQDSIILILVPCIFHNFVLQPTNAQLFQMQLLVMLPTAAFEILV